MPTIDPSLIPSVSPGSLFSRLTTDSSLNIRWVVATDPVYYETINRPLADEAVRTLIIAKTVDQISLRLSHQSNFPFVIPCKVDLGSSFPELPVAWIWDMHVSLPKKWEKLRLAHIIRIGGENPSSGTEGYTGTYRFVFSGVVENSTVEVTLFYADYLIESTLTYQITRITAATSDEGTTPIDPAEVETIDGFMIFRTLDTTDETIATFFDYLAPAGSGVEVPYEIADTPAGGSAVTDDFSLEAMSHGTGILTSSAWNAIPALDSDPATWLNAFNYPYRIGADRSTTNPTEITIPAALFQEFNIIAPASDEPSDDTSGAFSPVWVSRIERQDVTAGSLKFVFSTYNITDVPSTTPVEFASLILERNSTSGQVVRITDIQNLLLETGADETEFRQGFGKGHVALSSLWGGTTSEVEDFFDSFVPLAGDQPSAYFTKASTILSSFAISRVPRTVPTQGESEALVGSSARRDTPIHPSDDNRYVTEADQGIGDAVNFTDEGFPIIDSVETIGYKGSKIHQILVMIHDSSKGGDWETEIKPRLECLKGGSLVVGDMWWDGTRWKIYSPNGTFIG